MTRLRLAFSMAVALGSLFVPAATDAQQAGRLPRIGYVATSLAENPQYPEAFRRGLRDLGYVEGENIIIDFRSAEGNPERMFALTSELVGLRVDIIVTGGDPGVPAAKRATSTIPIVFGGFADPVGSGIVASLARPGANITGIASMTSDLVQKRLEILKEALPKLSRVAVLRDPRQPLADLKLAETAAKALELRLLVLEVRDIGELDAALAAAKAGQAGAVMNLQSTFLVAHRNRVVAAVAKTGLPAMYHQRAFVDVGGLMTYGPHFPDMYRQLAVYVDRILKGAKPADLPIAQPTKFELVINLKTAKALSLSIPPSVLARADEVIQ